MCNSSTTLDQQAEGESELVERLRANADPRCHQHIPSLSQEAADRIEALERRLEVVPGWSEDADGIACRNDTIKLQDNRITTLSRRLAEAEKALEFYADRESWYGVYMMSDGPMAADWSDPVEGWPDGKPGNRARAALAALRQAGED